MAAKNMNTEQMMRELSITFPSLWTRPLREFSKRYECSEGIWTGGDDGAEMPDGAPIFATSCPDQDEYDGPVHQGFIAWLKRRGWAWDRWDEATFFLVPNSYFDEPMGPWPREWYEVQARALVSRANAAIHADGLPF